MINNGAEYLVRNCIETGRKKNLLLYDDTTEDVVSLFRSAMLKFGKNVEMIKMDIGDCHGIEPEEYVRERMLHNDAVICLTQYSIAHTQARKSAEKKGISFLSLPEYTMDLLNNPAIYADYSLFVPLVEKYSDLLTVGKRLWVETKKGTNLYMNIENRVGNCCPGITNKNYLLGSPPDIEANVAPVENETNGRLVIDGSITDQRLGLLSEPVILEIKEGYICDISSSDMEQANKVRMLFEHVKSRKAYILGEFGIGFNNCAELCGNMLVDEGSKGCVHFGMGSNWTIGGENRVSFHLDFVLKEATVRIDDQVVIEQGKLLYED